MLQTPKNVSPNNETLDVTKSSAFSYTFCGDVHGGHICDYYDNDTDEWLCSSVLKYKTSGNAHNGESVFVYDNVFRGVAKNGKNYKYRYTLFQRDPNNLTKGLYNIYLCRGHIQGMGHSNEFYIPSGIENLRTGVTTIDGEVYEMGGAYIEITRNDASPKVTERRKISEYNKSNGHVVITLSLPFTPVPTDTFRIFTNYITTPYYYVMCRKEVVAKAYINEEPQCGIKCSLTYNQADGVGLKSYNCDLYQSLPDPEAINGTIQEIDTEVLNKFNIGTGLGDIDGLRIVIEETAPPVPETPETETPSEPETTTEIDTTMNNNAIEEITDDTDYRVTEGTFGNVASYDTTTGIAYISYVSKQIDTEVGARFTIYHETTKLIASSGEVYSYDLDYYFNVDYTNVTYSVVTTMTTQENHTYQFAKIQNIPQTFNTPTDIKLIVEQNKSNHSVILRVDKSHATRVYPEFLVYRSDAEDDSVHRYLGWRSGSDVFIDYTASNNHTYTYYVTPVTSTTSSSYTTYQRWAAITQTITTDFDGWVLSSLTDVTSGISQTNKEHFRTLGKRKFKIGEQWRFNASINSGDIITNLGIQLHTNNGAMTSVTRGNSQYENGTLSALVSTLNCETEEFDDDIKKINAWKKFISNQDPFLLQSGKGDCWIVNISDNPTRQYDNSTMQLLTTINISWSECCSLKDAIIDSNFLQGMILG